MQAGGSRMWSERLKLVCCFWTNHTEDNVPDYSYTFFVKKL